MRWRRNFYTAHRWLGLIVSLQLLAWTVSGLTFTLLDIDNVHGDFERRSEPAPPVRADRAVLTPAAARGAAVAAGFEPDRIARILLRERFKRTVYELFDGEGRAMVAVDATSGAMLSQVTDREATTAALADFVPEAEVASVELLAGEAPREFRGGPMPVYRVVLEHAKNPHLYICPVTGEVLKRRNRPWRIFDFFWMLHIMDYRNREDFNHWLLTGMALLALLTSASGVVLWGWRVRARHTA